MRAIVRLLLSAGLLTASLWPGQAHALLHSQCAGSYTGDTSCMFTPVGPNIFIGGSTTSNSLKVRVTDPTGTVEIMSCNGQFSCSASMGPGSTGTDSVGPPAGVGPLLCTVISSGSGYYGCASNT